MKLASLITWAAIASATSFKIYWVNRGGSTRVYAVDDVDDTCERARTMQHAKHVFLEGSNDNPTRAWFENPTYYGIGTYLVFTPDGNGNWNLYKADKDKNIIDDNPIGSCWKDNLDRVWTPSTSSGPQGGVGVITI